MHSILFVATIPQERDDWRAFSETAEMKLSQRQGVTRLAENVWLLDLQQDVVSLGWLVTEAERRAIDCGLLSFEHAPEWLPADFDPTPTAVRSELT